MTKWLYVLVLMLILMLSSITVLGQESGDLVVNQVLQSTVAVPTAWQVMENTADIRLRSADDSSLSISNVVPVVFNDGRALNSIDQADALFAENGAGAFVAQRVINTGTPFVLLEYSRAGTGSADSAMLVAPWDTRHYSVGILESSSAEQYTGDLSAAIDIFTSREPADNAQLVQGLVSETILLTSAELPTVLSGGEYTVRLPDGYQNDSGLAAVTGLLTFGFGSTSSLGLDFYGFEGQLFNADAPTVVIAPGTATQLLTVIGVQTQPRAVNVGGRYALITEGVTSIGNYMNVAVRQDSGNFWSVLVVMNATTPLNDTIREFGYSIAAALEADGTSDLLVGQNATLDVITGIDIPQIAPSPGAPQIVAVVGQPQVGMAEAGLDVLVVYGDMEGDTSSLTIALVSSDNPRTPQGDSVAISSDPARQQRGLASQELTWFCDFRTYDALYIMALEDDQGNRSVIAEVNIVCGGSTPTLTMLSGTLSDNAGADLPDDLNVSADAVRLRVDQQAIWDEIGATFFLPQGWSISGSDGEYISLESTDGFMTIYPIDVFPGDSYRTTAFAETSLRARSSQNETGEVTERTLPELDYTYYRTDFSDTDDDFDGVLIVFAYQDDYYAIYATQSPLTGERTALGAAAEAVMATVITGQAVTVVYPPFGQGVIGDGLDAEAAALAAEMGMLGEIITDVPETLIVFDSPPTLAEPGAVVRPAAPDAESLRPTLFVDGMASDVLVDYGDIVQGTLQSLSGQRSRRDSFLVFGLAGDVVTITVISDEFDPALEFFAPGSIRLAENDDFDGQNARITIEIPSDDEYEIVVTSREQGQNGEYLLIIEGDDAGASEPAPAEDTPTSETTIAYGDFVEGFLPNGDDVRYSFAGSSGDTVTIAMYADFDTYLELVDANNRQIAFNDDYDGLNSQIDVTLPSDGTYTIVARGFQSDANGAFTLTLDIAGPTSLNDEIASVVSLDYGSTVQGRLTSGDDVRYTFSGNVGDEITITMDSPAFDTYLELYDANLRQLAENDDYNDLNSQIDFILPSSGTYVIIARGFDPQASGSFILSLNATE
ncbi:MAG: PPC domain-containing protein [Anaerolineae bacterium]|nr:PPC domain-containing protein [Anaerolineae bacterium]NUQ05209.1 PPC domain-containing protein [Anaerolineae bacterium]